MLMILELAAVMQDEPIPYNRPAIVGQESARIQAAMASGRLSGDGRFSRQCEASLQSLIGCRRALMTPSCTHALEMAAMLLEIGPGDEVIMPSFTFVSTANAFALRGASIVFVDVRPDTLNLDERLLEAAITARTRAVVPVHYAGVACEMDAIMHIAAQNGLAVVEDAAQAVDASYRGKPLGSFGALAALSFHETKNITSGGEGGALLINDPQLIARAEIIREKGTNRSQFFRGQIDKYTWVDVGSSYLPSELQCAYLSAQLDAISEVTADRLVTWNYYLTRFRGIEGLELPTPPPHCTHNGHIFHVRMKNQSERDRVLAQLAARGINAVFHYVPLHSAPGGVGRSSFCGEDRYTTTESSRLLRLPLWHQMPRSAADRVADAVLAALADATSCSIRTPPCDRSV